MDRLRPQDVPAVVDVAEAVAGTVGQHVIAGQFRRQIDVVLLVVRLKRPFCLPIFFFFFSRRSGPAARHLYERTINGNAPTVVRLPKPAPPPTPKSSNRKKNFFFSKKNKQNLPFVAHCSALVKSVCRIRSRPAIRGEQQQPIEFFFLMFGLFVGCFFLFIFGNQARH